MEVVRKLEPRDIFLRIHNSTRDNVRLELEVTDESEEALKNAQATLNYTDNIEKLKGKFAKKKRGRKKAGGDSLGLRLLSATVVAEFKRLHPYLYDMLRLASDDPDDLIKEEVAKLWEQELNGDERQLFEDIAEAAQRVKKCEGNCKVHTPGLSLYVKYLRNFHELDLKDARNRWNDEDEEERQVWETMADEAQKLGFGLFAGLAGKRKRSSTAAVGGKKVKKAKSSTASKKKKKAPAADKKRKKALPSASKKRKSKVPGSAKKRKARQ